MLHFIYIFGAKPFVSGKCRQVGWDLGQAWGPEPGPKASGRAMEAAAQHPHGMNVHIHLLFCRAPLMALLPVSHKIKGYLFTHKRELTYFSKIRSLYVLCGKHGVCSKASSSRPT
jgi:hypothetical protein